MLSHSFLGLETWELLSGEVLAQNLSKGQAVRMSAGLWWVAVMVGAEPSVSKTAHLPHGWLVNAGLLGGLSYLSYGFFHSLPQWLRGGKRIHQQMQEMRVQLPGPGTFRGSTEHFHNMAADFQSFSKSKSKKEVAWPVMNWPLKSHSFISAVFY